MIPVLDLAMPYGIMNAIAGTSGSSESLITNEKVKILSSSFGG
jgi:hypothetical protein